MSIVRQYATAAVATETTILAADANNAQDVFAITVSNRGAADADYIVRDSLAGSTVYRWAIKAGSSFGFARPINAAVRQSAKNAVWTIQCSLAQNFDVTVEAVTRLGGS